MIDMLNIIDLIFLTYLNSYFLVNIMLPLLQNNLMNVRF